MPIARRPTVLHCVRDWGLPSERFVVDLVGSTRATRPVLVCGHRAGAVAARVRTYDVGALPRRVAERRRRVRRGSIAAVALAERARVLHAHLGYWAPEAAAVARKLNRPLVVSLHGQDLLVEGPDMDEPAALLEADRVIVPSEYLARAAVEFGISRERLRVIPSGVDTNRFRLSERHPAPDGSVVVTFVGRFVEKKGVLDAACALAAACRRRREIRARFVGYGPLEGRLRGLLGDLGLPAEIRDGGAPDAVATAFSDTHLVLTPSKTAADGDAETLGLVNLEALASGIPVVTTRHGGIPEAVPPAAGVLVDEGDVGALAAAIEGLVVEPARWPAMARAGRAHVVRSFDLGSRVAEVEDVYSSLLGGGEPHKGVLPGLSGSPAEQGAGSAGEKH